MTNEERAARDGIYIGEIRSVSDTGRTGVVKSVADTKNEQLNGYVLTLIFDDGTEGEVQLLKTSLAPRDVAIAFVKKARPFLDGVHHHY